MENSPIKQNNPDPSDQQQISTAVSISSQQVWAGPLPSPEKLSEYSHVIEDGAERIIAAWEKETEHRHNIEKRELNLLAWDAILGKVFAFIFVVMALAVSAFCAYIGAEWLGGIIGGGVIGSVVWAFVTVANKTKATS